MKPTLDAALSRLAALAREASLRLAAKACSAHSAVSHAIKALEDAAVRGVGFHK